jgi:predicted esterase YcpF (UPF0227 family)
MTVPKYIYLHGFASSPLSTKAQFFAQSFAQIDLPLTLIDLNFPDFSTLTFSRQLSQVQTYFSSKPLTLIGSSFGGLTATWLAQQCPLVNRLILLAPAFDFLTHLTSFLGEQNLNQWQQAGYFPFYHYGEKQHINLHYGFITDLINYDQAQLQRPISTLIIHGKHDDVIPIQSSRDYSQTRDYVQLIEVDSDHSLIDQLPYLWTLIQYFISQSL